MAPASPERGGKENLTGMSKCQANGPKGCWELKLVRPVWRRRRELMQEGAKEVRGDRSLPRLDEGPLEGFKQGEWARPALQKDCSENRGSRLGRDKMDTGKLPVSSVPELWEAAHKIMRAAAKLASAGLREHERPKGEARRQSCRRLEVQWTWRGIRGPRWGWRTMVHSPRICSFLVGATVVDLNAPATVESCYP